MKNEADPVYEETVLQNFYKAQSELIILSDKFVFARAEPEGDLAALPPIQSVHLKTIETPILSGELED